MIKMILAVDRGNAIGWGDGRLAIPGLRKDLARFKRLTTGARVVMGRKTFQSLNLQNGLPNRTNYVLSHHYDPEIFRSPNVQHLPSLETLVLWSHLSPGEPFWVIGGASVYDAFLDTGLVDEIHLTVIDTNSNADVCLRNDLSSWKRFVLQQQKLGINWCSFVGDSEWDGPENNQVQTTYIVLQKVK